MAELFHALYSLPSLSNRYQVAVATYLSDFIRSIHPV